VKGTRVWYLRIYLIFCRNGSSFGSVQTKCIEVITKVYIAQFQWHESSKTVDKLMWVWNQRAILTYSKHHYQLTTSCGAPSSRRTVFAELVSSYNEAHKRLTVMDLKNWPNHPFCKKTGLECCSCCFRYTATTIIYLFRQFLPGTLAGAGIRCHRVSVCPSVTSRCSTETAKHKIMQTTPHVSILVLTNFS